jgi:hypothetical protein
MVSYDVGPYRQVRVVDVSGLPRTADIRVFGVAGDSTLTTTISVRDHTRSDNQVRAILEPAEDGFKLRLVYVSQTVMTNAEAVMVAPASSHTTEFEARPGNHFSRQGTELFVELFVVAGARVLS